MAAVGIIIMEERHRFFPQCNLPQRVNVAVPICCSSKPIQTLRLRKREGKQAAKEGRENKKYFLKIESKNGGWVGWDNLPL